MSQTSFAASLMSNFSLWRENLLFSIRLISRQSSITFWRCNAELRTIFKDFKIFSGRKLTVERIIMTILRIGIIALRGVLSSWATDEKNLDLTFCIRISLSLNLVMSLQMAMMCLPWLITLVFTWIYLLGFLDLNTGFSITGLDLLACRLMMCVHKFSLGLS